MAKGAVSIETTIWCGICTEWNQLPGRGNVPAWRKAGWRMTLEHGWVCSSCSSKLRSGVTPEEIVESFEP